MRLDVKISDRILFGKYTDQTVKVAGEDLLVLREEDVMAVIEDHASGHEASGLISCRPVRRNWRRALNDNWR